MEELLRPKPTDLEIKLFGGHLSDADMSRGAYYEERIKSIKSGKPTFMVRNFDSDRGHVFDYYNDAKFVGMIVSEDGQCEVYVGESLHLIHDDLLTVEEAVDLLENGIET